MNRPRRILRAASLALYPAALAAVAALSLLPVPPVLPGFSFMDKLEHLAAYLALGALGVAFFASLGPGRGGASRRPRGGRAALASFGTALLFGAAIELVQPFTGRTLDPLDLAFNAAGAGIGAAAAFAALLRARSSAGTT